jgi:putative ABC transport system substrate-binding protein
VAGRTIPRIGYLSGSSQTRNDEAFRQGMRELGYIEGQNVTIEYRFADGKYEQLPRLASELVRMKVAVVVVMAGMVSHALRDQVRSLVPEGAAIVYLRTSSISALRSAVEQINA